MRFAPFAFETNNIFNGLTLNFWYGNYTTGSTVWNNLVPNGINANMRFGGFNKTTLGGLNGLDFTAVTGGTTYFTVNYNGIWDSNPAGTLIMYMNINSTTNKTFWSKQTQSNNGMAVDFTNEPYYLMRAPSSITQISNTANTSRGVNVYSFATAGGQDGQFYLNKTAPAMTIQNGANASWNNGFNFRFGIANSWTDPPITGVLNRMMFYNTKLSSSQISDVVDYCIQNA